MTKSFAAALTALTLGLSLPAWAGGDYPAKRSDQSAQLQTEQQREATPTAGQAQGGATSDASATTEKATQPDEGAKGQVDQAKKHPPTAVMDKATSPEKSTSEIGVPPKHPPATVMERATPEQKSPGSAEAPK
jgi:hypothetical protein